MPQPSTHSPDYRLLLDRLLQEVEERAYLTPSSHVDPRQREAMAAIERAIQAPGFDADAARALARRLHAEGRIDKVMMLSALHVIAAHPEVADYVEAARLAAEQEMAAMELGGPNLANNLAAVDRHRGVLAWLNNHPAIALDHFARALERQHNVENLGNVLCVLLRLGEDDRAASLVARVRATHPAPFVADLDRRIRVDPDLALLAPSEVA